jgi:hypothetical protein
MTIINFIIKKVNAERLMETHSQVSVTNNVSIKSVEIYTLSFGTIKEEGIKYSFEYKTNYTPKIGEIIIAGDIISMEPKEEKEKIIVQWEKQKSLSKEIMVPLLNYILGKCNIEAIILSKNVNLPPPIRLPTVEIEKIETGDEKVDNTKKSHKKNR